MKLTIIDWTKLSDGTIKCCNTYFRGKVKILFDNGKPRKEGNTPCPICKMTNNWKGFSSDVETMSFLRPTNKKEESKE